MCVCVFEDNAAAAAAALLRLGDRGDERSPWPTFSSATATRTEGGKRRGPSLSGDVAKGCEFAFVIQSPDECRDSLHRHKLAGSIEKRGPDQLYIAACRRAATCLMEESAQSGDSRWRDDKKETHSDSD